MYAVMQLYLFIAYSTNCLHSTSFHSFYQPTNVKNIQCQQISAQPTILTTPFQVEARN